MEFSEKVNRLLSERNQTQADLAKSLQVSQATVSRWLSGTTPQPRIKIRLADYFNVDVDFFNTNYPYNTNRNNKFDFNIMPDFDDKKNVICEPHSEYQKSEKKNITKDDCYNLFETILDAAGKDPSGAGYAYLYKILQKKIDINDFT